MGLLSNLFRNKSRQIQEVLKSGATIVDVRTEEEFSMGSITRSINIPLDTFTAHTIKQLKSDGLPIIVCCESGIRSASANSVLKRSGVESYNGGRWRKVDRLLNDVG